jgi:hypothetical protein
LASLTLVFDAASGQGGLMTLVAPSFCGADACCDFAVRNINALAGLVWAWRLIVLLATRAKSPHGAG